MPRHGLPTGSSPGTSHHGRYSVQQLLLAPNGEAGSEFLNWTISCILVCPVMAVPCETRL